jgi:hypothetical protein
MFALLQAVITFVSENRFELIDIKAGKEHDSREEV